MEAIRIEKLGQAFRYARMEEIEAKQPSHQEKPHRHDYYAVLLVEQAEGTHHIDFRTYPLHPRTVFFLSPEQVHHVGLTAPSPRGQVLLFTEDFLQQYCLPMAQFNELDLFFNCDETPPLPLDAQAFQEVASWGQTIRQEYEAQAWHWEATVGTWLRLILLRCQRVKHHLRHDAPQKISRQAEIMRQFKAELSTHFTQLHQVKAYAERLNLTSVYLNEIVKGETGHTAKDYIQNRVMLEAKRLALYSDYSLKQIAFHLGFEDASHFSKLFKKAQGQTFSAFRQQALQTA